MVRPIDHVRCENAHFIQGRSYADHRILVAEHSPGTGRKGSGYRDRRHSGEPGHTISANAPGILFRDPWNFTLSASFSGTPVINITAADGRKVRELPLPQRNGSRGTLDVSGMSLGLYHLTATDALGQRAARSFVVQ